MLTIAAQLGCSQTTVWLALHNEDGVPDETRELVRRTAEELGYRASRPAAKPAPRAPAARKKAVELTLAAVTDHVEACEPHSLAMMRFGAQQAAQQLGYRFEIFRVRIRSRRYSILEKMLRHVDAKGVLLFPMVSSVDATDYLDWSRYSVVAAAHEVIAPEFHRVVPDAFGNTLALCESLVAQGCRRLGFVTEGNRDVMAERRFAAMVHWLNGSVGGQPVTLSVHRPQEKSTLCEWFDLHRPDAIIAATDLAADQIAEELGAARRRKTTVVLCEHAGTPGWAGIDQRYRAIGAAAVAQLHARVQAGEKGIPEVPSVLTIKGEWVDALATEPSVDVPVAI